MLRIHREFGQLMLIVSRGYMVRLGTSPCSAIMMSGAAHGVCVGGQLYIIYIYIYISIYISARIYEAVHRVSFI